MVPIFKTDTNADSTQKMTESVHNVDPDEIQKFEEADQQNGLTQNRILFTGSSSIRMWSTLKEDFAPMPVINRGFGGSTIPEVNHYAERIVHKYKPSLIVFYCGENDISESHPPAIVFQDFKNIAISA